ncbi:MAG: hypothetical protein AAF623_09260 [Planctomycetota bacterium]
MSIDQNYDPVKNPRPEDLHAYGIVNALVWFGSIFAVGLILYYAASWFLAG